MPVTRIPIDGLWRCLCPSIDASLLSQASRSLPSSPCRPRLPRIKLPSARTITKTSPSLKAAEQTTSWASLGGLSTTVPQSTPDPLPPYERNYEAQVPFGNKSFGIDTARRRRQPPTSTTRRGKAETIQYLGLNNADLHARLKDMCTTPNNYFKIARLVQFLIEYRGEQPSVEHYDALIRANSDAEYGSVEVARRLLQEMQREGVQPNSSVYHSILQVLVNHPDYLLRSDVMREMREKWFGLSPEGFHCLVLAHLRDRELELAMDRLEQMIQDGLHVQPWLYDIFMYQLSELDELDEAFGILVNRYEVLGHDIAPDVWYYMLDKFSDAYHYEGTKYVWKARVQMGKLNPSDGMCLNILNLAGRNGDALLATSALRTLSLRKTALSTYHYEALLEAYSRSGDLETAFRILNIMAKAGIEPNTSNTRPLFMYLTEGSNREEGRRRTMKGWDALQRMRNGGRVIPPAAVNVLLEAAITTCSFTEALNMYKQIHTIVDSGPNAETFNVMLRALSRNHERDDTTKQPKPSAMFLVSEMRALKIKPDRLTYDRLILICLMEDDYSYAFRYLEEMQEVGRARGEPDWWMRAGTAAAMVRRCILDRDERAWDILNEWESRGVGQGGWKSARKWAEQYWNGAFSHQS